MAGSPDCKQGTLRRRFGVALAPGEAEHDAGTDVAVLAQLLPHLLRVRAARRGCGGGGHCAFYLGHEI